MSAGLSLHKHWGLQAVLMFRTVCNSQIDGSNGCDRSPACPDYWIVHRHTVIHLAQRIHADLTQPLRVRSKQLQGNIRLFPYT